MQQAEYPEGFWKSCSHIDVKQPCASLEDTGPGYEGCPVPRDQGNESNDR